MDEDSAGGWSLTDEHLDLYWMLASSRNRKGIPTLTLSDAQTAMGIRYRRDFIALVDEIADAGYWEREPRAGVKFNPDRTPPEPAVPEWLNEPETGPENSSASLSHAGRTCGIPGAGPEVKSLKLLASSSRRNHFVVPFGTGPVPTGAMSGRGLNATTRRWLARDTSRATVDLVEFFSVKVRSVYFGKAPGSANYGALGRHIKQWLNEGLEPLVIKQMIKLFVADEHYLRQGIPAWKSFVANRQRLHTTAMDRVKSRRVTDYWEERRRQAAAEGRVAE